MLTINYNMVTVMETMYLLSNYDGYLDGDKKCLIIKNAL
jgi:hypothetical protein